MAASLCLPSAAPSARLLRSFRVKTASQPFIVLPPHLALFRRCSLWLLVAYEENGLIYKARIAWRAVSTNFLHGLVQCTATGLVVKGPVLCRVRTRFDSHGGRLFRRSPNCGHGSLFGRPWLDSNQRPPHPKGRLPRCLNHCTTGVFK